MNIVEVIRLSDWLKENTINVDSQYQTLVSVLKNNSTQPTQQPVTEPFKELCATLSSMPTEELSTLQMRVLEELDIIDLIGRRGKEWLKQKIRLTTYDPATTFETIQGASQRILAAKQNLLEFKTAATTIGFTASTPYDEHTKYVVNVIFQGDASISNVSDWKKTAADWELIISGVAGVVGEKPEDIKVIGASNGSIIFSLSATPLVTKVLATISKHIASIANDYLDFQIKRQELERSRMMSDAIKIDLKRQEDERRKEGKNIILEEVKRLVPTATPEEISKLTKSIDKQISFSESGGDIDFITPPDIDVEAEDFDEELAKTVQDIRVLIEDYRSETQQTKLLTMQNEDDGDDDE